MHHPQLPHLITNNLSCDITNRILLLEITSEKDDWIFGKGWGLLQTQMEVELGF